MLIYEWNSAVGIYYLIKDILYLLSILYLGNEKSCKITAFFYKTGELVHENRRVGT